MTKREVMAKYGISMICQDLDEKADEKFEKIVKNLADISETVDQDIEKFCSKCNYRGNDRRCDSILKGCWRCNQEIIRIKRNFRVSLFFISY